MELTWHTALHYQEKNGETRTFQAYSKPRSYIKQGLGISLLTCLELLLTKKSYSHGRGMEKANQIHAVQKSQQSEKVVEISDSG